MKYQNAPRPWALAALLLAPTLPLAAQDDGRDSALRDPQPVDKSRFGISYRASWNINAEFKSDRIARPRTGGPNGGGPGPATGGGIDRFYDDGYNRVDSSGNRDNLTWFWGYENAGQVQGDTIVMSSTAARGFSSGEVDDDPQHGAELTYNRELGRCARGWSWGLESALGWTCIDIEDDRPLAGGLRTIRDAYERGGVVPPPPPYNGTFEGPGPLIGDMPTRTVQFNPNGSFVRGSREFEGNLFTLRLGPYLDIPLAERWTLSFSAGPALGLLDGDFQFSHTVTAPSGTTRERGSGSETDLLYGGYVSGLVRFAINECWSVFVGGQYLGLSCYSAEARGQEVELTFDTMVNATVGFSYSF
jgi:hypothetical protein